MPFYGFLPSSDPLYRHTMQFAVSPSNLIYQPKVHAISWSSAPLSPLEKRVPSTAPGYLKGAAAADRTKPWFDPGGALAEIRWVTDADGSVWWWSYGGDAKNAEYGEVVRGVPGKAGWFSGAYSVLFPEHFLGLRYDAPRRLLKLNPSPALGNFHWQDAPFGSARFDFAGVVESGRMRVTVHNRNAYPVSVEAASGSRVRVDPGASATF